MLANNQTTGTSRIFKSCKNYIKHTTEQAKIKRGGKRAGSHVPCMRYVYRKSKSGDSKTLATGQWRLSEQRSFVHELQKRRVITLKPSVLAKGHVLGLYAPFPTHLLFIVQWRCSSVEFSILLIPQGSRILIGQKELIKFLQQQL